MRKYPVLICMLIAVFFLVTATLLYPGGSLLNKQAEGFDWSKNFFSNLFLARALNGTENPSRIWALTGMVFHSIACGLFFMHTARKIPQKHTAVVLKAIGLLNMVFTFLIATSLHDIMVAVSSTLTMIGLFYITISVLKTKLHWLKLFCTGSLLLFYYTLYLYGAGHWGLLAVMQKVTFLTFMVLILTLEYFTKGEYFLPGVTNGPVITTDPG
ncbi:MAG TPA: hypothetical protein VHK69_04770 [Chitinophagaceae bacterium]|nr:hypothetical protein [Chitinophagaceae bacterium]